jgi:hypothetical protein
VAPFYTHGLCTHHLRLLAFTPCLRLRKITSIISQLLPRVFYGISGFVMSTTANCVNSTNLWQASLRSPCPRTLKLVRLAPCVKHGEPTVEIMTRVVMQPLLVKASQWTGVSYASGQRTWNGMKNSPVLMVRPPILSSLIITLTTSRGLRQIARPQPWNG